MSKGNQKVATPQKTRSYTDNIEGRYQYNSSMAVTSSGESAVRDENRPLAATSQPQREIRMLNDQLNTVESRNLLKIVDDMREILHHEKISLPHIVVVGDQSVSTSTSSPFCVTIIHHLHLGR